MSESDGEKGAPWAMAMAALSQGGERLATVMKERGDEADAAGVYTTMLGILMNVYLNQIAVQTDHPTFVPCTGYFQRLGTPNPDTVYRCAPIDDQGVYRIVGERGTTGDVSLMAFSEAMRSWPAVDLTPLCEGPNNAFDILASPERPSAYDGQWLKLEPGMASLWLRSVSDRWDVEIDPWIAITKLNGGSRQRMSAEWLAKRLEMLVSRVTRGTEYGIEHVSDLIADGFVNQLKLIDYGTAGAMPLQSYHEGVFRLADDEALVVEARMAPECRYFSWALTDAMFVTLDWMNTHASINSGQAEIDADGVLRVVVSNQDPGVPNWMQTVGCRSGVLQARTVGSTQSPEMNAEVVPLDAVSSRLPPGTRQVTIEQRRQNLQKRQLAAQRRRLW